MIQKLNAEQQQLIAQNHNLIYGYVHKKKLDLDEYYDILALAMCRAALGYDSYRSRFQTYAYMVMDSEVNAYQNFLTRQKRKPSRSIKEIHLDESINDSNKSMYESSTIGEFTISPSIPLCELCEGKIMAKNMLLILTDKERQIAIFKLEGLSNSEVGEQMNCSAQNINYFVQKIKGKWNEFFFST